MNISHKIKKNRPRLGLYAVALAVVWTISIFACLVWNIAHEKDNTLEIAKIQARIAYEKDVIYRRWNTLHGGVYVPVTEDTMPNPFMSNIPDRDVITTSGRKLTLMNPDYMMRQVDEFATEQFGVLGHITSLNPTRKENAPDSWEAEALRSFEEGTAEVSSLQTIDGSKYMRLIRPIYTEEGCMQCHAKQVYKIGDVRGGLSVAILMEPLKEIEFLRLIKFSLGFIILWFIGLAAIFIVGRRLIRNDRTRRQTEEQLIEHHTELQAMNLELDVLNRVSTAISQTIDLNKLLTIVLETITGLELFRVEQKGGIFILDGNKMNIVAHLGHTDAFMDLHKNMKIGDCLCGIAAQTGEIIVSHDSCKDSYHTVQYPGMTPHGHIIIPLKSMNRVIGVLYLYTSADAKVQEHNINLLRSIGSQIGIAIENSRLYEETKDLSLRDPLTELANRRLLDIVLERSFARAARLKRPLSIIMLDIDYFKQYNDKYGHAAGDTMLIKLAEVLIEETREIDLVIRYGGEEFLISLPEADINIAHEVSERIRTKIKSKKGITVSIGIASYTMEHDKEELINKADSALYQAKQKGRDRVEING